MTTMRAAAFHEFGGPQQVQLLDLPMPRAGSGEVVVRVAAATVNPTDVLMLTGMQAPLMTTLKPPFVAGMEFAGVVHETGDGVTTLSPGQPVMGIVNPRRPERGAHAEYVVVPQESLAALPGCADLVGAATLPMNGLTALMVIEALALRRGATVLLTGAAGAVGGYVIALAREAGLTVIADAKDTDVDWVRQQGAHEVVPRGDAMAAAVRAAHPAGVDGLVDAALLGNAAAALVRDGGIAVTLRRSNPVTDARLRTHNVAVTDRVLDASALRRIAQWLVDGVLVPRVAERVPLADAAQAFRMLERGGLRGRVVLVC
jgi:NADPH:quinone reductase